MIVAPGTSYMDVFERGNTDLLRGIYRDRIKPYVGEYPFVSLAKKK